MSNTTWGRHDDEDAAVDEILDAAGRVFAEVGVGRATMVDVARAARCSRATLYRYFPSRSALHVAFVNRATLRIARDLEASLAAGAPDALVDRVTAGVAAVRADPLLAVWFEPENLSVPLAVSQDSDVLRALANALAGEVGTDRPDDDEIEWRGEWLLRSIVSLLAMPGSDAVAERRMIESFVVPVLIPESHPQRSN